MKKIKVGWIIHIFALLHAAVALTCRLGGVEDELLLTILTMMMALLISIRKGLNVEFAAASIIMVNIIGFLLGNAVLQCLLGHTGNQLPPCPYSIFFDSILIHNIPL